MGLSDELEALRNAGNVKSKSTSLSKAVSIHGFTSPEAEAEKQKRRLEKTKSARLDAANALRQGAKGAGLGDLDLLYKKMVAEHREKKREAERNLREWRKKYQGTGRKGGEEEEEEVPPPPSPPSEEMMNEEAVEMLPERVVAALKARYETEDAASALSQALKEETEAEGKGHLAELMEVPSPVKGSAEGPRDEVADVEEEEEAKRDPKEEEDEEETEPEPAVEEKEEKPDDPPQAKEEEEPKEEAEPKGEEEPTEEEPKKEEPEEEDPKEEEPKEEEPKEEESKVEEPKAKEQAAPQPEPDLSGVDGVDATRRFYDTHAQEFVDNISPRLALTPASHREAFLAHVHLQQLMNADDPATILDAGCGYGRDALFFGERGHNVLGVDFSRGMLEVARDRAPRAHYLRADLRRLGDVLLDGSVDGVWAHASLGHLPKGDALDVLQGLRAATRTGGVLYLSLRMRIAANAEEGQSNADADTQIRVDERYGPLDGDVGDADDSRIKLYCYYSMEEVDDLLADAGWEVMEVGEDDRRGSSDYVTHSTVYAFAVKRK